MAVATRIKRLWNAFKYSDETEYHVPYSAGPSTASKPDRVRPLITNEKTIIAAIYNRIAIDVAAIDIRHIKLDEQGRYESDVDSGLNDCLSWEANIDQGPRSIKQDIVMTMLDYGAAAIVPVDTIGDPVLDETYEIETLRVGPITKWHPRHVRVNLFDEARQQRRDITLAKRHVAIAENPLYAVMNEMNSTLQRLVRKLSLLDVVDEQSSSGKLDIIIQLPYAIKSETRRDAAEKRRTDIEWQLKGSQYGVAYIDGTEKVTQLNRPAENNLLKQVEYLTNMLYGQLGLTESVMNGTADEPTMKNYFHRTVEPIVTAIVESMQRTFVGKKGKQRRERIRYFQNPFKLVPVKDLAEIADKFVRNEILTSNELREFMGIKPSKDPKADELKNSNMPQPEAPVSEETSEPSTSDQSTGT